MASTMDEIGTTLPTDEHTTESAVVAADVSTLPSPGQLTPEHVCMEVIGTQLINIESIQQTIRTQVWNLENNNIGATLLELRSLLPKLDGLQNSLRKALDAHTRPLVRIGNICDMPNEILRKIFEDVRGDFDVKRDKYPSNGIKDIQSLRLTCRGFCDASSPLLLHRLDVSLTASSLAHLDEVSRHPTISKGIRSLQIWAALYNPVFAGTLQHFIGQVVEILREDHRMDSSDMHDYLGQFSPRPSLESFNGLSPVNIEISPEIFDSMGKRHEILRSCTNYLRAGALQPDDDQNMSTLCQVYRRYNKLCLDQNALLQYDTFVASVAEAVARIPTVAGLFINDFPGSELLPLETEISSPIYSSVRRSLFGRSFWTPEMVSLLPCRPFKLLYQLPIAFFRAGNPLTELSISLDTPLKRELVLSEEQAEDLIKAAEQLKVLEIDCHLTIQVVPDDSWRNRSTSPFASLLLNGIKLRSVALRFGSWSYNSARPDVGPLLALLPWANLEKISLACASIQCDELSEHLEKLTPGTHIRLEDVHLLSGLWADLLDVLRLKADCHSKVISPGSNKAAERTEAFYEKFPAWNCKQSPVTAYIRGQISENPLRLLPGQDDPDTEDMAEED